MKAWKWCRSRRSEAVAGPMPDRQTEMEAVGGMLCKRPRIIRLSIAKVYSLRREKKKIPETR